jgi:lipoic acid synthetase/lipoate-protein ligase A
MTKPLFPATFVALPQGYEEERAPFYLATEEYLAMHFPESSYLCTWQLSPTVVMGRHQDAQLEIDQNFCKQEGIDIIRRKSGGGSVYADKGNIMTSLITGEGSVELLFKEYALGMASCLNALGAKVEVSGRNDIVLTGGGKICGNAFYHLANRNIVHGTMLYDTNIRLMSGALTPERAKLLSKGVKSVQSRVSLLKDTLSGIGIEELRRHIRTYLTNDTIVLDENDIRAIREIEATYYDEQFLRGKSSCHTSAPMCQARIEGCGTLTLRFETEGGTIKHVMLSGDYFELDNASAVFNTALAGCPFTKDALTKYATEHTPNRAIRGLSTDALCSLMEKLFE